MWPVKLQAIDKFPFIKLATQSPASLQQHSGLKHIDH